MGLDQHAFSISRSALATLEDPNSNDEQREAAYKDSKEIAYWRKHANLQEWMTNLAVERGVVEDARDFNCKRLVLCIEDLEDLERCVRGNALPHGEGFFWGQTSEYHIQPTLDFIEKAKEILGQEDLVYYYCWW